jgi:hypothetical protein
VAAVDVVDAYLAELADAADGRAAARRLAHAEWGLTLPPEAAAGHPLDVGLRVADGLVRAQAVALPGAADLDPWMLLWWNRQTRPVRFGCTRSRDVWVHAELPAADVDSRALDRLLGLVAEAAIAVRQHAARRRAA